jgi:hypothetical protein
MKFVTVSVQKLTKRILTPPHPNFRLNIIMFLSIYFQLEFSKNLAEFGT